MFLESYSYTNLPSSRESRDADSCVFASQVPSWVLQLQASRTIWLLVFPTKSLVRLDNPKGEQTSIQKLEEALGPTTTDQEFSTLLLAEHYRGDFPLLTLGTLGGVDPCGVVGESWVYKFIKMLEVRPQI